MDIVRFKSLAASGSTAFLQAIPYDQSLELSTEQTRAAMQMILGIPQTVIVENRVRHCAAGHQIEDYGNHFLNRNCGSHVNDGTGSWRINRHDYLAATWRKIARESGVNVARSEPMGMPGMQPNQRGDIALYDYPQLGKTTVLDVDV